MQPWTELFGGTDPMDDSANVLSVDKKSYLDLMLQNCISIFDFRSYLFARQCYLLLCLGRPVELLHRAKSFVANLTRGIIERRSSLIPFFLESWVFSVCSDIVEQCERILPSVLTTIDATRYEKMKGELMLDARRQVPM